MLIYPFFKYISLILNLLSVLYFEMHGSDDEYAERDLMRDSSQTLPNDDFHPGIDEEEMLNY